jgi:hypothetical protein
VHQHRFRLIVGMVRGRDHVCACVVCNIPEEKSTRPTRPFFG